MIHGAPEIVLHSLDANEHLVHGPLVPESWPTAAQTSGEAPAKFLAPAPNGLIGDDNSSSSQEQLNIPLAEAEHVIQPDSVADNMDGKAMAVAQVWCRLYAASLVALQPARQTRFP